MEAPGGLGCAYAQVPTMETKALFTTGDWGQPAILRPAIGRTTYVGAARLHF